MRRNPTNDDVGDEDLAPYEPTSDARQAASVFWDHYRAFQDQGFSKAQSLQLVGMMMTGGLEEEGNHE